MILLQIALLAAVIGNQPPSHATLWTYAPPDAAEITVFEWRAALNSKLREPILREMPVSSTPLFGSINFILGIERILLAADKGHSPLVVLQGRFDVESLREMAQADGGSVRSFGGAEILEPPGGPDESTQVALVGRHLVLIGERDALRKAIDQARTAAPAAGAAPSEGYDLWVRSEPEQTEFGIAIGGTVRVDGLVRAASGAIADQIVNNAKLQEFTAHRDGNIVRLRTEPGVAQFEKRAGLWRTGILELARPPAAVDAEPQVIRIHGLDSGSREIPLAPR